MQVCVVSACVIFTFDSIVLITTTMQGVLFIISILLKFMTNEKKQIEGILVIGRDIPHSWSTLVIYMVNFRLTQIHR